MTIKKYQAGDTVFFARNSRSTFPKADTTANVIHAFIGKDDNEYVVVEFIDRLYGGEKISYTCLSWKNIFDTMDGESNFMKAFKDPSTKVAHNLLVGAGIIDEDGNLTETYR